MFKGVSKEEEEIIRTILAPYFDKYNFYFYGSRVTGGFRQLSDLDILIKGKSAAQLSDIYDLKEKFDSSDIPYIVNFVDFYNIDNDFYNLIKKDLLRFA